MGEPGHGERPPGGEAAFTAVFQEHYPACLRLARRIVRDGGLAHEVVQEVFLAWWGGAGGGYRADRGELGAWLSTLTHHKAVDAVRTAERHRRLLTAAASALPVASKQRLVDEVVWWELGRRSLDAALSTLSPAQREVLDLAYVHGLTQAQIAERLCIPLGTVKSRTHAGMLRLRAAIGDTWTPTEPTAPDQQPPTRSPSPVLQDRQPRGAGPATPRTGTVRDDVDLCATALVHIASAEDQDDSAAMISRAAALVDKHGDPGLYGLVVALARRVADGGAEGSRSA